MVLGLNIHSCPDARPISLIFVVAWSRSGFSIRRVDATCVHPDKLPKPVGDTQSMSDHIVHVTDDSFESEVLQSNQPVLIDYWAEWCGPCKMIAPVLDDIANEYTGRNNFV